MTSAPAEDGDVAALVVLGLLLALALLGPRFGRDSRQPDLPDRFWWPEAD